MTDLEFANLIKKERALKNLTLQDVSNATDLSLVTLVKIEKTGRCLLRTKLLLAKALGLNETQIDEISK